MAENFSPNRSMKSQEPQGEEVSKGSARNWASLGVMPSLGRPFWLSGPAEEQGQEPSPVLPPAPCPPQEPSWGRASPAGTPQQGPGAGPDAVPSAWLMIARPPHLLQLPFAQTLPGSCAPLPPQAAAASCPAHTLPWQEATKCPWGQATLLRLKIPLLSCLHGVQILLHRTRCHLLHAVGQSTAPYTHQNGCCSCPVLDQTRPRGGGGPSPHPRSAQEPDLPADPRAATPSASRAQT